MVTPGRSVELARHFDPGYTAEINHSDADAVLSQGVDLLAEYQDRLSAQDTFGVLLVLQGLDAAGKDSTIKHVTRGVNPQGVGVRLSGRAATNQGDGRNSHEHPDRSMAG